jgi:hypothetical protein
LRALHEAGIKIDVVSGRGIGVAGALFAAIDAAPKTWEEGGLWRRKPAVHLYRWRPALQAAVILFMLAALILLVPLLVLSTGLVVYPFSFLVQMVSVDSGHRLATAYAGWIGRAFSPGALPTLIPRLITLAVVSAVLVVIAAALRSREAPRTQAGHRDRGVWWTRLIGPPWRAEPGLEHFLDALWQLFRGPASAKRPPVADLSRRYVELLTDNLDQPGFRELIVSTLDLETRTDLVFAALREERRPAFFHSGQRNQGDLIDLSGVGRSQVIDALAAALSLPVLTEPHVIAFSPESYWKGEAHRTCDRTAAAGRLLEELAAAGVEQVIVVTAFGDRSHPHRLNRPHGTVESRVSEHLAGAEAVAVRDAIASQAQHFQGIYAIQPAHNPIGPFDFEGAFDERSDRFQSIEELVDRGYEDAYRQFIETVVEPVEN